MLQHSLDASWLAKCCIFPRGTNGFPRCSTFFLASTVMALWMDPMDGWMATLSLQQRWFKSIYQVVRNVQKADLNRVVWWNLQSENSHLWDFPFHNSIYDLFTVYKTWYFMVLLIKRRGLEKNIKYTRMVVMLAQYFFSILNSWQFLFLGITKPLAFFKCFSI